MFCVITNCKIGLAEPKIRIDGGRGRTWYVKYDKLFPVLRRLLGTVQIPGLWHVREMDGVVAVLKLDEYARSASVDQIMLLTKLMRQVFAPTALFGGDDRARLVALWRAAEASPAIISAS